MKIAVTQKEIEEGDAAFCPVERAFKREGLDAMVGPADVSFFAGQMCIVTLPLPPVAARFVAAFDADSDAAPIEFELSIPDEVLQQFVAP